MFQADGWPCVHFVRRGRGESCQIVTGCSWHPCQFEKLPTTLNEPSASVGAKTRARTRTKDEDAAGARGFRLATGVCRATPERDTRPKPAEAQSQRGRIAPSPHKSPNAPADKKAPSRRAGHLCPLPPTTVAGARPCGAGGTRRGGGPPRTEHWGGGPIATARIAPRPHKGRRRPPPE